MTAFTYNHGPGNSRLERFPTEIIKEIMQYLDAESLSTFILASRRIRRAFLDQPGITCHSSILTDVPSELLPLAMARYAAQRRYPGSLSRSLNSFARYEVRAIRFCKKYLHHQARELTISPVKFSLKLVLNLLSFHMVVMGFVGLFIQASTFKRSISWPRYATHKASLEHAQIVRAFYILELVRLVIPLRQRNGFADKPLRRFWKSFTPCEARKVDDVQRFRYSLIHKRFTCGQPAHRRAYNAFRRTIGTQDERKIGLFLALHLGSRKLHTLLRNDIDHRNFFQDLVATATRPGINAYRVRADPIWECLHDSNIWKDRCDGRVEYPD
ncbi:hypothetical protein BJ170DRAFT_314463 [Xylariales sp. AK1849]|nr:hypothetical protein BJ170DRAFT_314463 [Xylariales sp. AK1849]